MNISRLMQFAAAVWATAAAVSTAAAVYANPWFGPMAPLSVAVAVYAWRQAGHWADLPNVALRTMLGRYGTGPR